MKISEAIQTLQEFQKDVGDVDLVMITDLDDSFVIEDRYLDIVDVPSEDETHYHTFVAFLEPEIQSDPNHRPLKLV